MMNSEFKRRIELEINQLSALLHQQDHRISESSGELLHRANLAKALTSIGIFIRDRIVVNLRNPTVKEIFNHLDCMFERSTSLEYILDRISVSAVEDMIKMVGFHSPPS